MHAFTFGGEFRRPDKEAAYRAAQLPESTRHAGLVFAAAALINILFLWSDWRFSGSAHFLPAIVSRIGIVVVSLCCQLLARVRRLDVPALTRLTLAWCVVIIPPCAVLVSPQTAAALIVVFLLPIIFYLILPLPFRWGMASGVCCSAACLGSFLSNASPADIGSRLALILSLFMANVLLGLIAVRTNRLQRQAWAADQDEQKANRELNRHRAILQALLRAVPVPLVILVRDDDVLQANDAARAYFGEAALLNPAALAACFPAGLLARLAAGRSPEEESKAGECVLTLPEGNRRDVRLAACTASLRNGEAVLITILDITDHKKMERQLKRLATTDMLTSLPNRAAFFVRAAEEIQRFRRYGRPIAVLMADIDHFKEINDSCGHDAGDRALRALAQRCRPLLRTTDFMGRIGGEEFAVLLPETSGDCAVALAERLRDAVSSLPSTWGDGPMTVSIGVAAVCADEASVEPALGRADSALYAAKNAGRNCVRTSI